VTLTERSTHRSLRVIGASFEDHHLAALLYFMEKLLTQPVTQLALALVYFEQLLQRYPNSSDMPDKRLHLVACIVIANKFLDDQPHCNSSFCQLARTDLKQLNRTEVKVLQQLDYQLNCSEFEVDTMAQSIMTTLGASPGQCQTAESDVEPA
jgi:Cyclin, N-terminal domain